MTNLFTELLALHTSPPIETFIIKVLAGVLQSDSQLLDKFVNELLEIKGAEFTVSTQQTMLGKQISLLFKNKESLCFFESRVDARSDLEELNNYKDILNELQLTQAVYLRYCTKYYDYQPVENINFKQFRWADIYLFLNDYTENTLVASFLHFLQTHEMDAITQLNVQDLFSIEHLQQTIRKMDECLDSVVPEFIKLFGSPNLGLPHNTIERLRLFIDHKTYRMCKKDILAGKGIWSEIGVGFVYEPVPVLAVWLWVDTTHSQYETIKDVFLQRKTVFEQSQNSVTENYYSNKFEVRIDKALSTFAQQENILKSLQQWLLENLYIFKQFVDETEESHEIEWNLV